MSSSNAGRTVGDGLVWCLVVAAVVTLSLAAAAIQGRAKTQSWVLSDGKYVAVRNRREVAHEIVLHRVTYQSPGGETTIRWYDSDLEPTAPREYSVTSIRVDGRDVASVVKGSLAGTYEDGDGELLWTGVLRRARHVVEIVLDAHSELWGVPYTNPGKLAVDSLTIIHGPDAS